MSDHQHIVEQIRGVISATDQTKSPQMVELASAYAALCAETNARLRRCTDYLRQGLRAEAIHLAEEHPALLEMVAALDLAEAGEWENLCAMYELARPPRLLIDAAQELNEAYAAAEPLKLLLDRHRRLALERGPLADRIGVMRLLAQADAGSAFWVDDLRTFEAVRIRELRGEAVAAAKGKDRPALARLLAEVSASGWSVEAPVDVRSLLERSELGCRQEDAVRTIRAMLPDLDAAYSAMDFTATERGIHEIQRLSREAHLTLPADLKHQLEPVEDWLAQQRAKKARHAQFEEACGQLSLAIEGDAPEQELGRLKGEALALGGEIPDDLSRRMREAIRLQQQIRQSIARRKYATVAAVMICLLAGAGMIARAVVHSRRADDGYRALTRLIGQEDYDGAQRYWQQMSRDMPYAAARHDLVQVKEQLDEAVAREADRKADFENHFKVATSQGPLNADMRELSRAESLAKTPAERLAVMDFSSKVETAQRALRVQNGDAIRLKLAELKAKTQNVELAARNGAMATGDTGLETAESMATQLSAAPGIDAEQSREVQEYANRLKEVRGNLARLTRERDELQLVLHATDSAASLKQALDSFVEHCPDSPRAVDFKQAAANAASWEAIEEAAKLFRGWNGDFKPPVSSLAIRIEAIAAYTGKYVHSPFTPPLEEYRTYLTAWQKTVAADGPWKGDFHGMLSGPLLAALKYIKTSEGKCYYLPSDGKVTQDSIGITFKYIVSGDVSATKPKTLTADQFKGDPAWSPQSLLVAELGKRVDGLGPAWETFGLDLMESIAQAKEVDPILRVILLDRAIKLGLTAAWGDEEVLKSGGAAFVALNADDLAWMNPDDKEANAKRNEAAALLGKLTHLKEVADLVLSKRDALMKSLRTSITGRGLLLKEADGWTIIGDPPKAGQEVYGTTGGLDAKQSWLKVAEFKDGKFAVDDFNARMIQPGNMVFICTTPPGAKPESAAGPKRP